MLKVYLNYLYNSVTQRYSRALFRLLERNPKAVLLDAGCWDGQSTLKYARAIGTKNAIGLELVKSAAEKARQKTVKARIADLNKKMPLKSNGVDVIVANHVIEHLYNPHVFVEQLYRVLKPGGYTPLSERRILQAGTTSGHCLLATSPTVDRLLIWERDEKGMQ